MPHDGSGIGEQPSRFAEVEVWKQTVPPEELPFGVPPPRSAEPRIDKLPLPSGESPTRSAEPTISKLPLPSDESPTRFAVVTISKLPGIS